MSSPPTDSAAGARLAASQLKRIRRIVDAAVALAEVGGFEGVKLRHLAESSGVALGTLYKYFPSKEAILVYVLNEEAGKLERVIAARPPQGATAVERVTEWFARATRGITRRPEFGRAVLRAIASGTDATSDQQAVFHLRVSRMVIAAMRNEPPDPERPLDVPYGSEREQTLARILEDVWFASLLGWVGGLHPTKTVTHRVSETLSLLLGEDGEVPSLPFIDDSRSEVLS